MDTANKTAIVTGGSRGIGAAAALLLAREGWRVAVGCHRHPDRARALCDRLRREGREAVPFCGDVSSVAEMEAQVQAVVERWGQIDLLVNNAGIAQQRLFTEITEAEWDRMFAVNAKGLYACCRAVVPGMIRRHSGNIINVSSMWGQAGASCEVHYSAAKAAVIGFTKALAKELGPSGIRVNCVAPGVIATEMNAALDGETLDALREETPLGTIGTPEEAARAILWLAGDGASFVTGQVIGVNGGFVI
jgi:3-oxoacyl-[acyl-carrier protein] reductase